MARRLLVTGIGRVEFEDIPDRLPGTNEVKVKSALSGISHGSELSVVRGTAVGFKHAWNRELRVFQHDDDSRFPKKTYPVPPGYECVGKIVDVAQPQEDLQVGDMVWIDRPHAEEHIVSVAEARAGLFPRGMSPRKGIFAALTRVALGGIHDAKIKLGDRVAVVGLGTVGLLCVQLAHLNGAQVIYAIDMNPVRLAFAKDLGATPINATGHDAALIVKQMTPTAGVDVAIEASGECAGLETAIRCCCACGTVVTISSYNEELKGISLGAEFHRNRIQLISSMTINECAHRNYPCWNLERLNLTARELLASDKVCVEQMITHTFEFPDARQAYDLLSGGDRDVIKIALSYE